MSMDDKARHRGEELKGSVKEGWGKLTHNRTLEAKDTPINYRSF
jgi:uncharacterized protein YjbJ (UPF0337 family)